MARRAVGEGVWMGEGGRLVRDLQKCMHCGGGWIIDPTGPERGFCRNCMGPTCGREGCVSECIHWEKQMETVEAASAQGLPPPQNCGHCHVVYQPVPGSGRIRGICRACNAHLCGAPRCLAHCSKAEAFAAYRGLFEAVAAIAR